MSRSLSVSLSACALVALLLVPGAARAQGFTEADLVGEYAFNASGRAHVIGASTIGELQLVGVFSASGVGEVTGSRSFSRPVLDDLGPGTVETVRQEFVGTYSVEADGTGVMSIEPSTAPDWIWGHFAVEFDRPETLRFALADGGHRVLFDVEQLGRVYRLGAEDRGRVGFSLEGQAMAQEPSDDLADMSARVDLLTAQLCELLRLLNTPQGQRETSTPEVIDACGTGYRWNGEGAGGTR